MAFNEQTVAAAIDAQHTAAHDESAHVRTIAGPGTGKSFTIEERICWLLGSGIAPQSVAAVSFTRAAARDLERRIRSACERQGHDHEGIAVSTLHSLALRALKAHGVLAAYPVDPTVLDTWELRNVFDAEFGHSGRISGITRRAQIREDFEAFWSTGTHEPRPSQRPPDPPISEEERSSFIAFHAPRTQLYACVLPGEIVQRCVGYMSAGTLNPAELLDIDHLIVDEFQDLNPMDLRFVNEMADFGVTLFVAGDDDQSLYSFRYALPEGIQRFDEEYPGCGDHTLRHCFRCTPRVLSMAQTLIEANPAPHRINKDYVSLYEDADPPLQGGAGFWSFRSARDEARAVAGSCRALIDAGMDPRQIMVLLSNVRALSGEFSEALSQHRVPFEPPREQGFRDTEEGRALFVVLRLIGRTDDLVALRTLLTLRKGVGIATADGIAEAAIESDRTYSSLFYEPLPENVLTTRHRTALIAVRDIAQLLLEWSPEDTMGEREAELDELLPRILNRDDAVAWRDEAADLPGAATLGELARYLAADKDEQQAAVIAGIATRLGDETTMEEALPPRVRVMTMHGAKGLSAQVVFIPGLEEEILPGAHRSPYVGQVMEAARMLFVSITRAKLACIVSYSRYRFINGAMQAHHSSRFAPQLGGTFKLRQSGMTAETAERAVAAAAHLAP